MPRQTPSIYTLLFLAASALATENDNHEEYPASTPSPFLDHEDLPTDSALVTAAFASVFSVRGNPIVTSYGPAPRYAFHRLRILFPAASPKNATPASDYPDPDPAASVPSSSFFDPLATVRSASTDDTQLLVLLFKALAGHFVTSRGGTSGLSSPPCTIVADPRSGGLDVESSEITSETVLTMLSILLLLTVVVLVHRIDVLEKKLAQLKP